MAESLDDQLGQILNQELGGFTYLVDKCTGGGIYFFDLKVGNSCAYRFKFPAQKNERRVFKPRKGKESILASFVPE